MTEELNFTVSDIDWKKVGGLVPAVVQDSESLQILMLGYMNEGALQKTVDTGHVTFFSRTKERLWTKGESSKNYLNLVSMKLDCDNDTVLVFARPEGDTCHLKRPSCFGTNRNLKLKFLDELHRIIENRKESSDEKSYTTSLFKSGVKRMAQKVGEEGVEVALAAMAQDREELINESSDLIFHLMVLLQSQDVTLEDIVKNLESRHRNS